MKPASVQCLCCGHRREPEFTALRALSGDECPRCGYAGWVDPLELDLRARIVLLRRPLARRSHQAA